MGLGAFRPVVLSPSGAQRTCWAGSPLTTAPLSAQVLCVLLVLTAVAELALAFLEDTGQDSPPAVQYTNPSLYMVTWVSASWTSSPESQDVTAGTSSTKLP